MEKSNGEIERFLAPLREGKISLPDGYSPTPHEQHDTFTTTREGTYKEKGYEIRTTYRIVVDGEPFRVHTSVLEDGSVVCHSFPQYAFRSAVELVERLIDASMVELPSDELGGKTQGGKQ